MSYLSKLGILPEKEDPKETEQVPQKPVQKFGQGQSGYQDSPSPSQPSAAASSVFTPSNNPSNPAITPGLGIVGAVDQAAVDYLVST